MPRKYPPECPVFENLYDGLRVRAGAILEAVEVEEALPSPTRKVPCPGFLGLRLLDPADLGPIGTQSHPADGWFGVLLLPEHLRPLTPAAEDMLALVSL